jgi:hypothetical protein
MRDLESRIRAVVRRRTPKGWKVIEKPHADYHGRATSDRVIVCPRLDERDALLIFLHEAGHVVLGHLDDPTVPDWKAEYEADQWAMKAMRAEGVAVPERARGVQRHMVRCYVEKAQDKDPDLEIDDEILRYCYPDNWKLAA